MRLARIAWCLGLVSLFWGASWPAEARADEAYTVALFTPSLDFRDGVERNDFVTRVAEQLAAETGVVWQGKAFARRADFEAALRKSALDVVIVDGDYFAAKGARFDAVASLAASGGATARAMALVVASSSELDALHELRGRTLAVPDAAVDLSGRFVAGDVLGGELAADDFFGRIEAVKDVRAAINAVELGKADAALIYDTYDAGLRAVVATAAVPLPVVAITSSRLQGELLSSTRRAARNLSVSGAQLIRGSGAFDDGAVRDFKARAARARVRHEPELAEPELLTLELGPLKLPEHSDAALAPATGDEPLVLPSIHSLGDGDL